MSNKKISDLAAATAPSGAEYLEILQGGVNKKVLVSQISTLVGTSVFVDRETPIGDVDGVNDVFTIAVAPIAGSDYVYSNGLLMTEGVDYTRVGATFTFTTPPEIGDTIRISSRK